MPALFTVLGVILIVIAIPFGMMVAPLLLGVLFVWLGWRHVSAGWQVDEPAATTPGAAA